MAVIEVERNVAPGAERVAVVWLNRPEARNALSGELVDALVDALRSCAADPGIGSVVLAGRGSAFCAGGDLKEGLAGDASFLPAHVARGRFADLLRQLPRLEVPVVAAVHGDAMGGGFGLAAACDVVLAAPEARFGTPEIRLGLFPWIIAAVLQRDVPRKKLQELVYTGGRWTAEEAERHGAITRVVREGTVFDEAVRIAVRMASFSPATLAAGKRALQRIADLTVDDGLAYMHGQLSMNLLTEDAQEGIAAFLERRPPTWKGR